MKAIRPMNKKDLEEVLVWRNHPSIRNNMLSQHKISKEEHIKWFESTISNSNKIPMIYEEKGIAMGYVNFNLNSSNCYADWGFYTSPDAIMAAVDTFHIDIKGVGGHGAMPHETCDPVIAACGIAQAIQTIVSRNHYALDDLVVSVTQIHTGTVDNVIPDTAYMNGTVRTFDPKVQDMVERRLNDIVAGQAASYGVTAELRFERGYPATITHATEAAHAAEVAREVAGENNVIADAGREMGAEDFAYMLQERPGAYLFLGQGESAGLHHPEYNFNDEIAPVGASFFARLVERSQPLSEV